MNCLDNIYTKQIKYNSPVLYQLESLKKEYEKLLKVSNEIIKTGSFIEECYFENQSAVLSDNEITFIGNLKFKTDSGNYFQNIPSSLKLNVQGTGEIVVDVGEDNKTLVFKLDEEFLSEISLMIENLETLSINFNELKTDYETLKSKFNSQIFDNFIGIRNTTDSKIDQIKHINNNFQITSNDGKSLLNIDEQLEKISSFNKRLLTENDLNNVEEVETIYDKSSDNIELNLGFTNGLAPNQAYSIDLTKYKKIYVYTNVYDVLGVTIIDLSTPSSTNVYVGNNAIFASNVNSQFSVLRFAVEINSTKTIFKQGAGWYGLNDVVSQNSSYMVYKIEGVIAK